MEIGCSCDENRKNKIIETLQDVECDEIFIEQIMRKNDVLQEQIYLLSKKRAQFLEQIHIAQKRLDCMDYLIYELKKEVLNPVKIGCKDVKRRIE